MFNSSPSLADIAAVTGGNRNDGAWGDGGWWVLIILFALFGGWGGYGFGGNGGGGYTATAATQADIQRGFDNSAVISKLDGITNGLCDGFYAVNNGMLTGFNTIQQAINADTVAGMQNANAIQSQLANCCCETREAIQGVNFNMAQNTCALQFQSTLLQEERQQKCTIILILICNNYCIVSIKSHQHYNNYFM